MDVRDFLENIVKIALANADKNTGGIAILRRALEDKISITSSNYISIND